MKVFVKKTILIAVLCSLAFVYGGVIAVNPTEEAHANWLANWEAFASQFLKMLLDTIMELIAKIVIAKTIDAVEQKINDAIYGSNGLIANIDEFLNDNVGQAAGDLFSWYANNCMNIDIEFLDPVVYSSVSYNISDCPPIFGEGASFAKGGFVIEPGDDNVTDIDLSLEDYLRASALSDAEGYLQLSFSAMEAELREQQNKLAKIGADGSVTQTDSDGTTTVQAGELTYRQKMTQWAKQRVLSDSKNIISSILAPLLEKVTDEFLGTVLNQGSFSSTGEYKTEFVNRWQSIKDDYEDKYQQ